MAEIEFASRFQRYLHWVNLRAVGIFSDKGQLILRGELNLQMCDLSALGSSQIRSIPYPEMQPEGCTYPREKGQDLQSPRKNVESCLYSHIVTN